MKVLGIDPGPEVCGWCIYHTSTQQVEQAAVMPTQDVLDWFKLPHRFLLLDVVAIERVQSYGIAGASLLRTAEVCGRIWQASEQAGLPVRLLYRRQVLQALDVTGKGNRDSLVRQRLIEMHGGTRKAAVGLKSNPGPLHGVASHAWQALAVGIAATSQMHDAALDDD